MSRVWIGSGSIQVAVDDQMAALVRRVLDNAVPTIVDEMESAAQEIYNNARDEWPVKTGKSRDQLDYGIRLPNSVTVEAFVANRSPYANFIKGKNLGYRSPVVELIRKPVHEAAKIIAEELGPELRKLLEDSNG